MNIKNSLNEHKNSSNEIVIMNQKNSSNKQKIVHVKWFN